MCRTHSRSDCVKYTMFRSSYQFLSVILNKAAKSRCFKVVISCFSTGLATARYILDTEVHAVGTGMMLQALAPYENSNRIPLSIIHALFVQGLPAPTHSETDDQLSALLTAVAYCMQPNQLSELREAAEEFLAANYRGASNRGTTRRPRRG